MLFLPSFLLLWENKVNPYSNQLKLSWVCKLEWILTIVGLGTGATVAIGASYKAKKIVR